MNANEQRGRIIHDFVSGVLEEAQKVIDKLDAMNEEAEKTERTLKEVKDNMLISGVKHD